MFIKCKTQNGNTDVFYIPNMDYMNELKKYADQNLPIKCCKLRYEHTGEVYLREGLTEVYLYLDNYLYYKEVQRTLIKDADYEVLYNTYCKKCNRKSDYGCMGKMTENGCESFGLKLRYRIFGKE